MKMATGDDETMMDDVLDGESDSTGSEAAATDEARKLASALARAIFTATQKVDGGESIDQKSPEFKEKWASERPRLLKIARFALRRLSSKGYRLSSEAPEA
jgi:2C-methyl-D-erythritol 2,4-cyclodiphosphate synthase